MLKYLTKCIQIALFAAPRDQVANLVHRLKAVINFLIQEIWEQSQDSEAVKYSMQ